MGDISSATMSPAAAADPRAAEWFGQPRGLTILFLTEMWDEFSYYGMRALLVYYMVKRLALSQEHASIVYGAYTAFTFFTPIIGALISDRWLGRRRSVLIGGSIMALGHFMMAFEPLFYAALVMIGVGNGLFLPSLPSQINGLYAEDDPRRRTAYNVYYVGVNIGAFLAPLAVGTVGEIFGWHWGFTLAGIGLVIGLAIYVGGSRYLPREPSLDRAVRYGPSGSDLESRAVWTPATLQRFALLSAIVLVVVIFRMTYEQIGNTLSLWIEVANRHAGDFVIPMTWFQSLDPLLVVALTPVFVARWLRMARQGREPSSITKMARGAAMVAGSYLMLAGLAAWSASRGVPVEWPWLVLFFVFMTAGELYILPIGLGLFGRLAPEGFSATAIALWFLAAFAGSFAAGLMGVLWSQLSPPVFFAVAAAVALVAALLLLPFDRPTRRAAHE